jgi:branched-chain amino acid transport system ATP-binding protein
MNPTVPILELSGVVSGYGAVTVLREVDLSVEPGEVVALLGPNGAGKTSLLRAASGLIRVQSGEVRIAGAPATKASPSERARRGLCLIPEGRGVFRNLTVKDNLRMCTPSWVREPRIDAVFAAFPILKDRQKQLAGTLSGGEQQMLALSRAVLAEPAVVLVDEVSMGLAPIVVDVIFDALRTLAQGGGVALLVVEQYVERALAMADRCYLIKKGQIVYAGSASELKGSVVLSEYLGQTPETSAELSHRGLALAHPPDHETPPLLEGPQ